VTTTTVAITGATGYLGTALTQRLRADGHRVVALTRRPPTNGTLGWREYSLGADIDEALFDGIDVLIHAAWTLGGKDVEQLWDTNTIGSRRLISAAAEAGVQTVFISSMSAYFGTRQAYGLMKLAAERTAVDLGAVVVRPGLVYGASPGGMGGTLKKIAQLPLWPRFSSARLYLAHEDDLTAGISAVLNRYDAYAGQVLGFANPTPHDLTAVLTALAPNRRRRPTILIPKAAVMAPLRVAEAANVPLPFRSDSLLGLVEGPTFLPNEKLLADGGINFRDLM